MRVINNIQAIFILKKILIEPLSNLFTSVTPLSALLHNAGDNKIVTVPKTYQIKYGNTDRRITFFIFNNMYIKNVIDIGNEMAS